MRTLIRGGTVVTAASRVAADVLIDGEHIAAVAPSIDESDARVVDAGGKLILPGGVDVHTHLDMPLDEGLRTADDFQSGTVAAACGGTTTVVDYVTPARGEPMRSALETWMSRAAGRAVVDYGFHVTVAAAPPGVEAEMTALVEAGVPSFKVFMAYPGRLMLDDGEIFRVLRHAGRIGALVCLHAENGTVIDVLVREALAAGQTAPAFHALTRPPEVEAEAVGRAIALAELAGAPLYVVHVSSSAAAAAIGSARRRGLPVLGETCPQYLFLSDELYGGPALEAAKFVMSPPLRRREMQAALWDGLRAGDLQVVATDHCPFRLEDKARGLACFPQIPNGGPGIETRLLLLHKAVSDGRLSLERLVDVASTTPARLFGLWPRKGTIAAGSDADLVILDPAGSTRVSVSAHHSRVDYDLYEGWELPGSVTMVLSRGEVIVEGGRFAASPGRGRFLRREPFRGSLAAAGPRPAAV